MENHREIWVRDVVVSDFDVSVFGRVDRQRVDVFIVTDFPFAKARPRATEREGEG
jgi:hypothetical protein